MPGEAPNTTGLQAVSGVAGRAVTGREPGDPATTDSDLAVLVLQVSWALADAAHDLPAGDMTPQRREELADTVQALCFVLRANSLGGVG